MEFSAPATALPAERWRTATIVASGVAALELVLLVILLTAMVGKGVSAQAKEAAMTKATGV